ncbi:MAG: LemA family protein [Bdellovibrionota bacterium]
MMSFGALIFVLIVGIVFFSMGINIYNGMISLRNQVERAWSNIDVILKQRFDEIPQLIQVIEQYAKYEAGLLEKIAEARKHYGEANSVTDKIKASQEMSFALKGIIAIGEAYPELKANQNFVQLQSRVSNLESMLADRREAYNEAVTNFNTRIDQFPDVFVAKLLNYQRQDFFNVEESEKIKPSLEMNMPKFGKGA